MVTFDTSSLIDWFIKEMRPLPWRQGPTPYIVWVSEVMLQQTRASVVAGYFTRWMERFPSLASFAEASLEEVMKLWEGLGYYSRVRNLHEAAQYIIKNHGGNLPDSYEELVKIKGLGPYTIGAILSFAFHKKAAAVDGNVLRVLTRYFLIEEDIQKSTTQKKMRELCFHLLPDDRPHVVMEALIELGAKVCKTTPLCRECPIKGGCKAYEMGAFHLPFKGRKEKIIPLKRHVFVIQSDNKLLLKQESLGKVMGGLYEFPYLEFTGKSKSTGFLQKYLLDTFGLRVSPIQVLPKMSHFFTKYKAELFPYVWKAEHKEIPLYKWFSMEEVKNLPFSSGHRRIINSFLGEN